MGDSLSYLDNLLKLENTYFLLVIVLLFVLWDLCLCLCLSRSESNLCFNYL